MLKSSQVKLSRERRVPERLGGLSAMLIGHGGRGSGQAAQGHLVARCRLAYLGWQWEAHLPFPRRPDCCCHCWRHPAGRGQPDTSGRAGGVPCTCGQEEGGRQCRLISRAQGTASQPAPPRPHASWLEAGKAGFSRRSCSATGPDPGPREQRLVGGRAARAPHLPSATVSFRNPRAQAKAGEAT